MAQLALSYLDHAKAYNGEDSSEYVNLRLAVNPISASTPIIRQNALDRQSSKPALSSGYRIPTERASTSTSKPSDSCGFSSGFHAICNGSVNSSHIIQVDDDRGDWEQDSVLWLVQELKHERVKRTARSHKQIDPLRFKSFSKVLSCDSSPKQTGLPRVAEVRIWHAVSVRSTNEHLLLFDERLPAKLGRHPHRMLANRGRN